MFRVTGLRLVFNSYCAGIDFRVKRDGPCPESRVGPLSESDNTLCKWGRNWD